MSDLVDVEDADRPSSEHLELAVTRLSWDDLLKAQSRLSDLDSPAFDIAVRNDWWFQAKYEIDLRPHLRQVEPMSLPIVRILTTADRLTPGSAAYKAEYRSRYMDEALAGELEASSELAKLLIRSLRSGVSIGESPESDFRAYSIHNEMSRWPAQQYRALAGASRGLDVNDQISIGYIGWAMGTRAHLALLVVIDAVRVALEDLGLLDLKPQGSLNIVSQTDDPGPSANEILAAGLRGATQPVFDLAPGPEAMRDLARSLEPLITQAQIRLDEGVWTEREALESDVSNSVRALRHELWEREAGADFALVRVHAARLQSNLAGVVREMVDPGLVDRWDLYVEGAIRPLEYMTDELADEALALDAAEAISRFLASDVVGMAEPDAIWQTIEALGWTRRLERVGSFATESEPAKAISGLAGAVGLAFGGATVGAVVGSLTLATLSLLRTRFAGQPRT